MFLSKIRKFCGVEGLAFFPGGPPEVFLGGVAGAAAAQSAGGAEGVLGWRKAVVARCSSADGDCGGRVDGGAGGGRGGGGKGGGQGRSGRMFLVVVAVVVVVGYGLRG